MRKWLRFFTTYWLPLVILVPVLCLAATSKIYLKRGTAITFKDSGGSYVLAFNNNSTVKGAYSGQVDVQALSDAYPDAFSLGCLMTWNVTPTVGETVDFYIALSDGSITAGASNYITTTTASAADALTTTNSLLNLTGPALRVQADSAADNTHNSEGFAPMIPIPTRYFQLVEWNASTKSLKASANTSSCTMTPLYYEAQ